MFMHVVVIQLMADRYNFVISYGLWTYARFSFKIFSEGYNKGLDFSAFCVVNYLRLSFYYSLVLSVYLCILCAAISLCVINDE